MKNLAFKKYLYRWYGEKGENLKSKLLRSNEIKYMYWFRKAQSTRNPISKAFAKLKLRDYPKKLTYKFLLQQKLAKVFT